MLHGLIDTVQAVVKMCYPWMCHNFVLVEIMHFDTSLGSCSTEGDIGLTFFEYSLKIYLDTLKSLTLCLVDRKSPCKDEWYLLSLGLNFTSWEFNLPFFRLD